jgi:hypothetical protein
MVADDLFARTHRVLSTPRPVWVRLSEVFVQRPADFRATTVRDLAFGIDLAEVVEGTLFGWYKLNCGGSYWGLVRFAVTSRNGRLRLDLNQLVPAAALTLREDGAPDAPAGGDHRPRRST